ncbi:TetR/AcrR family transcriptional regulator [Streptomyces sp. ISL-100]|uniref:TetR/AcrR family transcriptional regulator n=1 Tax=Streptomyces sp. ISL-100 TaxID=2819173 RepID=UPI001BEAFD73|nr:TetR/AcrR family transcriptional regulator [Streptomyces sp. ISL-100]MBT2395133.1 TetR/AcrR family transcriptional regulator [Streptomyces sp. ISL-100]
MARPRKFDEERAVDAAMEAFWTAGYEATSTQDLCDATGLGRSSIYNTFKSKRDLFDRALARYMEYKNAELAALMEIDLPVRQKIRTQFQRVIDEEFERGPEGRGCLVVNTAVEVAARDREVADDLARDYRLRLALIRAAIESGQRDGDIARDKDPAALAHFVIATIAGLKVSARVTPQRSVLESVADAALAAL